MKKVLYFIAGQKPTTNEQTDIDNLMLGNLEVGVRSAANASGTLFGDSIEPCDYKAGTPPASYNAIPNYTGSARLPTDTAAVKNGVALSVPVTGTYVNKATPTVINGVVTAIVLG